MTTSRLLTTVALLCTLIGCTNQEDPALSHNTSESEGEMVVFQERNPACPLTDYQNLMAYSETRVEAPPKLDEIVGRSYKLESFPFESSANVGLPVLDVAKYEAAHPDSYTSKTLKENHTAYNSFCGFSRYEAKSQYSRTVSSGVNLNFLIFKINTQLSYTEIFKTTDIQIRQNVFGDMRIKYYHTKYEFIAPVSIRKDLLDNYRVKAFVDRLYSLTPNEIIKIYGGFVLSKFYSGGQATALYSGQHNESAQTTEYQKESDLNAEIGASIKKVDASVSGGSDVEVGNSTSVTKRFNSIQFSLCTIGGLPTFAKFTSPENIFSSFIDLSEWCNSLTTLDHLAIAELPADALIPISEFVEEDNLKAVFHNYYKNGLPAQVPGLLEPCIELRRTNGTPINEVWETHLVTRYGDRIILRRATMAPIAVQRYSTQELARVKLLFPNLKIVGMSTKAPRIVGPTIPIISDINEFAPNTMTKFTDTKTGKTYLLTQALKNGKKIAYTVYNWSVANDYTFTGIINRMPMNSKMNLTTIRSQYYQIAL